MGDPDFTTWFNRRWPGYGEQRRREPELKFLTVAATVIILWVTVAMLLAP